ncbi:unnamed protein product [Lactuca virosa]|uniref:phosphopyruvate hydratase n=1 Tax=Lactuca virosa TaxID=75947 RepID=A0AAU9M8U5_9ASTR|nr:unnamed protein product [Lactuca virosa]
MVVNRKLLVFSFVPFFSFPSYFGHRLHSTAFHFPSFFVSQFASVLLFIILSSTHHFLPLMASPNIINDEGSSSLQPPFTYYIQEYTFRNREGYGCNNYLFALFSLCISIMIPLFINSNGRILKFQHIQVFGDELLMSNPKNVERAIEEHACNAVLLKVNQVGSMTEAIKWVLPPVRERSAKYNQKVNDGCALTMMRMEAFTEVKCQENNGDKKQYVTIYVPHFGVLRGELSSMSILIEYEILWLIRSATHLIFQLTGVSRLRCLLSPTWQRNQVMQVRIPLMIIEGPVAMLQAIVLLLEKNKLLLEFGLCQAQGQMLVYFLICKILDIRSHI